MLKKTVSMIIVFCAFGFVLGAAGTAVAEQKIAFPCDGPAPELDTQLCLSNVNGSDVVFLTNFSIQHGAPIDDITWSPNGYNIMFTRWTAAQEPIWGEYAQPDGKLLVFRIHPGGTGMEVVELAHPYRNENANYTSPIAWSPVINASEVAAISPFGQFVVVFLLGGATALYLNRKRESAGA